MMEEINDSIIIKSAETDEELCGRGYVHCTSWQEAYRGIVCDQYLDTMTVEATTARARQFPENTLKGHKSRQPLQRPAGLHLSMGRILQIRQLYLYP